MASNVRTKPGDADGDHAGLLEAGERRQLASPPLLTGQQQALLCGVGGLVVGMLATWLLLSSSRFELTAGHCGGKELMRQPDDTSSSSGGGGGASGGGGNSNYQTAAAQAMMPWLRQRRVQLELDARWGLKQAPASQQLAAGSDQMRIPRIMHHIYIPNIATYEKSCADPASSQLEAWGQSCPLMHPGWEYVFWGGEAANRLVREYYPEYAEMFEQLDSVIKKADTLKFFIMHAIGGLFLDLDIECWRPGESWLTGADVVLQGTKASVTTGVFASVPGHPVWRAALDQVLEAWRTQPTMTSTSMTGPLRLRAALLSVLSPQPTAAQQPPGPPPLPSPPSPSPPPSSFDGEHRVANSTILVHSKGSWYSICTWNDAPCHKSVSLQRAVGAFPLTHHAGYHRYAATWLGGGNSAGIHSVKGFLKATCGG